MGARQMTDNREIGHEMLPGPSHSIVFQTIQKIGTANAYQISQKLLLANPKQIETKLEELTRIGIVRMSADTPTAYTAVSVNSAFPLLAESVISESISRLELLSDLSRQIVSAAATGSPGRNAQERMLEVISDEEESGIRLHELTAISRHTIDSYIPYIPTSSQLADSLKSDVQLKDRGIALRMLYSPVAEDDISVNNYCEQLAQGNNARLSTEFSPTIRFVIFDNSTCYIRQTSSNEPYSALIVKHPTLVALMDSVFEHMWQYSEPVTKKENDAVQLTAKEITVIRLLAEGKTHFEISKALNIAPRTVDRILERLELRVGVSSRFKLAIEAQKRGWLDPCIAP